MSYPLGSRPFTHKLSAQGVGIVDRLLDLGDGIPIAMGGGLEVSAIQAGFNRNVALTVFMGHGELKLAAAADLDGVPANAALSIPATLMVAGEKIWRLSDGFVSNVPGGILLLPRWAVFRIEVSGGAVGTADINAFLRIYGHLGAGDIKDISP